MTTTPLAWASRLETRVAMALAVLVTAALGTALVSTTGAVSSESRDRAVLELDVARASFHRLLEERANTAIRLTELITELPVFRAHLVDSRLAGDRPTIAAMIDGYRAQVAAEFAVVTNATGHWAAQAGWPADTPVPPFMTTAVGEALSGAATRQLATLNGTLYLVVVVPARFADEVLGTFSVGYQLTDQLANELARLARCEVVLVSDTRVAATSLDGRRDPELQAMAKTASSSPIGIMAGRVSLGGREYVAGAFQLASPTLKGDAGRLLLLSDWQPTQGFIDQLFERFASTGVVILTVALAAGALFSRRLTRPLRDIASAAAEIAAGNLKLRLAERGPLETLTVARAFNEMSASLSAAYDRLAHDATHDHLTNLPNRALFMERLDRALIRRTRHPDYCFAVLFIDLDRFKQVNDSLGHRVGDQLLLQFSDRLAAAVRRDDVVTRAAARRDAPEASTLARVGGDEFVVLLDDLGDPIDAVRVARRVQQVSATPLRIEDQDLFATPSIGVAVCTPSHHSSEALMRDADVAMQRAKQAGGNRYAVFDDAMHDEAVGQLQLETELRRALERREFCLHYQPMVSLDTGRVSGFEALIRWQHPERGLLAPAAFLHVAEEVGLMPQIDDWVLGEASRHGHELARDGGVDAPSISVNLSAKGFEQPALVQQVAKVLHDTGFPASSLRLEVTEGIAMRNPERARDVLRDLRTFGVRISLDDFGTGYCSLSYLQKFPVDTLKIDRSFVSGLGADGDHGAIVSLMVSLARTLKLDVVAEGAEHPAQVERLKAMGCTYGQGYYFARPLSPDAVSRWRARDPRGLTIPQGGAIPSAA